MKNIFLILILLLSACSNEVEPLVVIDDVLEVGEYETIKYIVLPDGREFEVGKLINIEKVTTESSISTPIDNSIITVYSDPFYSLIHNGASYSEHAVPYLVGYNLNLINLFEIDYDVEHVFVFENGEDASLVIEGNESFLEYEEVRKLITSDGDDIVYERLVVEDFMTFYDLSVEIIREEESFILDGNGNEIGVKKIISNFGLNDYAETIKVTINGVPFYGVDVFDIDELTFERMDLLKINYYLVLSETNEYYN